MTSYQAFQRKCDDKDPFQRLSSHCVYHQHECISGCWLLFCTQKSPDSNPQIQEIKV